MQSYLIIINTHLSIFEISFSDPLMTSLVSLCTFSDKDESEFL